MNNKIKGNQNSAPEEISWDFKILPILEPKFKTLQVFLRLGEQ